MVFDLDSIQIEWDLVGFNQQILLCQYDLMETMGIYSKQGILLVTSSTSI